MIRTSVQKLSLTYHSFQHFPKYNMSTIQPFCFYCCDKELRAICVFSSICHTQPAWTIVLQLKILIFEAITIDAFTFNNKQRSPINLLMHNSRNTGVFWPSTESSMIFFLHSGNATTTTAIIIYLHSIDIGWYYNKKLR